MARIELPCDIDVSGQLGERLDIRVSTVGADLVVGGPLASAAASVSLYGNRATWATVGPSRRSGH